MCIWKLGKYDFWVAFSPSSPNFLWYWYLLKLCCFWWYLKVYLPWLWLFGCKLAVFSLWVPQPYFPCPESGLKKPKVIWSFWLLQGHWGYHLSSWHPSRPFGPSNDHPDHAVHSTGNETGEPASPPSCSLLSSFAPSVPWCHEGRYPQSSPGSHNCPAT